MDSFLELIKNKAFYHSSKVSKQGFEMLKKLLKFPSDKAFPVLDIYRMFLMHPQSGDNYKVYEHGLEYLNIVLAHARCEVAATQLVALRCLVNLFNNNASLYVLQQRRQQVLDSVSQYIYSENKNVRTAAITLILNYSVMLFDKPDPEANIQIISALSGGAIRKETDAQCLLRILTALGNI